MENWREAQKAVLERLAEVRKRVEGQDEGTVMALINQQDEFCEAAQERRASSAPTSSEVRCNFCEGSIQSSGCLGRLEGIDKAVLENRWEEAGALVDEYIAWVKSLSVE